MGTRARFTADWTYGQDLDRRLDDFETIFFFFTGSVQHHACSLMTALLGTTFLFDSLGFSKDDKHYTSLIKGKDDF